MDSKVAAPTLFRNPLRIPAAFTDKDRGIRIAFSKITKQQALTYYVNNNIHSNQQTLEEVVFCTLVRLLVLTNVEG